MRIIFLDMDGVVNSEDYFMRRGEPPPRHEPSKDLDPAAVELLNELVLETDAHLVLSSTWRLGRFEGVDGLTSTKEALSLRGFLHVDRFLGATPTLYGDDGVTGRRLVRGDEIQAWMDEWHEERSVACGPPTKIESFVILDDSNDMAHLLPRLVRTSWTTGLTRVEVEAAKAMLLGTAP